MGVSANALRAQGCLFEPYFVEYDVEGLTMIYKKDGNKVTYCKTTGSQVDSTSPMLPASTFLIMDALIALEVKAVLSENTILKWDGSVFQNNSWNADTDMVRAFQNSTLWYFQELARRIGEKRMAEFLEKSLYGNMNIGSVSVDMCWLDGDLRITPKEQIHFLQRLYRNELPFVKINQKVVKALMIEEEGKGWKLVSRLGWTKQNGVDIGWYIGWVEKDGEVYFFATCITNPKNRPRFDEARSNITKKILRDLYLIP